MHMNIRFATDDEISNWDQMILKNPDGGNVFQGREFARQKRLGGWVPRFIVADDLAVTALEKHVFGLGKLWYLPKGPGVSSVTELDNLLKSLSGFARTQGVFVLKLEPELEKTDTTLTALNKLDLVATTPIQPNFSTVLIDLSPNLDSVMKGLNQKGRHAIRRAERDGVVIKKAETTDENCYLFHDMLVQTADAQGFSGSLRSYEYYRKFWQRYADTDNGQLFFAYFDGKVVAGAFALVFGTKSTYKDGASMRAEGAYGVTHLLQWHVITWAKEHGSKLHDLCGAPPSDQIDNKDHPHYGIGRFKTSFNKHVTDYVGVYDLVVQPTRYALWTRFGERIAKRLWYRKHHESWY
jgi:lipid II:glycine glycyltransferase (peptidoglycan interpeptide bridge formation enzyme)